MYEVTITRTFAAAHAIRLYDGSVEPVHGHNWPVEVTVAANELDSIGVVMDFHLLETALDTLIHEVNNKDLNRVGSFGTTPDKINPSAERVAWWFGTELARSLPPHAKLVSVRVGEAPGCYATYRP